MLLFVRSSLAAQTELITNGSFVNGSAGWTRSGNFFADSRFSNCHVAIFHFYASWNGYDITMDQILCEIADAYKDQVFVGSIDTHDRQNSGRCKELPILNLPAIAIFVNGQHLETVTGLLSRESLKSKVRKWLTM
jgi:thiol-disulfide isomerase/thioredoxin